MSIKLKLNEYKCESCKGIFKKGWTDDEADEERKQRYGTSVSKEECSLVCDDCYNKILRSYFG